MRIAVVHNEVPPLASHEEHDVLVQANAVSAALKRLGHDPLVYSCSLNLAAARDWLSSERPDGVFNLVESLGGADRLMPLATMLFDALQLPYTGARTDAMLATTNKVAAKRRLAAAALPTPRIVSANDALPGRLAIVKPIWEHASVGMGDDAVVDASDASAVLRRVHEKQSLLPTTPHFAEEYIEGREFNLALLTTGRRAGQACAPQLLPAAEIDFSAYPRGKPRIVGSCAKWDVDSFEYVNTPRRLDFADADRELLDKLSNLALECWHLFDMTGYARVDFRVDGQGNPWILEVNANPCLAPDAGFAAALTRASIDFDEAIARIVEEAMMG